MNPATDELAAPRRPKFRWRILPVIYCGLIGGCGILGAVVKSGMMFYGYLKFGAFAPDPDWPSSEMFALTGRNIFEVIGLLSSGIVGLLACNLWWRGEWKLAGLLTLILIATQAALGVQR